MEPTAALLNALNDAKKIAIKQNNDKITIPYLWKAYLTDYKKVSDTYQIVEQNPEFLEKYIDGQIDKTNENTGKISEKFDLKVDVDLAYLLHQSERLAEVMGDDKLDIDMTLIALMDQADQPIQMYLRKKNVTKADIIYAVQKIRGGKTLTQNASRSKSKNPSINVYGSKELEDRIENNSSDSLLEYGVNMVEEARDLDPVIGRNREIREIMRILQRKSKNNPLLIGEPGVGKSAIIEGLAQRIASGDVPQDLQGKTLFNLDMSSVVAGATYRGEFEERLKEIIDTVRKSEGEIILFIDEIHTIVGAGDSGGGMNAGNILKPALARGDLRIIGATTLDEYRKYFEKDKALDRRFQRIVIEEPSDKETLTILRGLKPGLEAHHGVVIEDEALGEAVDLSTRYITDRQLPDKAIDLIDEASALQYMEQYSTPQVLDKAIREVEALESELEEKKYDVLSNPSEERTLEIEQIEESLNQLRDELADRQEKWRQEKAYLDDRAVQADQLKIAYNRLNTAEASLDVDVVNQLIDSEIPELQANMAEITQNLSVMSDNDERLVNDTVSKDTVAEIVARRTGIPVARLQEGQRERLMNLNNNMRQDVIGQDEAVEKVTDAIIRSYANIQDPDQPLGSFLFLGPTGVGKTELAKTLSRQLFGSEEALIRIDMSEYMEKHSVSRLVGSPPGYVGYDEGGQLSEAVRQKPYSIVLFDEIEKAHQDVFNILLQVLDDGRLTDSQGRVIDFRNTIVIMTSNIGSNELLDAMDRDGEINDETAERVRGLLRQQMRPEFLNRIDDIILFSPLTIDVIKLILNNMIRDLSDRLLTQNISLQITDDAKDWVVDNSYDPAFGARPLSRFITQNIETPLAYEIVSGEIEPQDKVLVQVKDNKLDFKTK